MTMGDDGRPPTASYSPDPEPGVPLITWVIGGAALLVTLVAGALFLDASPPQEAAAPPGAVHAEEEATSSDLPAPPRSEGKNPLEVTASFLDAQERARLWNPAAILSSIELVVQEGAPLGPIKFEFGEAVGQAIPGAPLSAKRHSLSYEGEEIEETTIDSPKRQVGLPEPNCPLEVAFRKLGQSGVDTSGRVGVLYLNSQKHGRPIWLMTNERGQATSINADSCALLRL